MYMAPEQLAGDPNMDSRADFYAIGVMAYEMLTGQVPFAHPTPRALLAAQLSEAPRPLRELRPEVPARLAKLVAACLQKDPEERPASANAILAALDDPALLSDEFATGRRTASTATVPVPTRGGWLRIGLLSGGILAAAAGAILMAKRSGGPVDAGSAAGASVAVLPFQDQSADSGGAYLAEGLTDAITTMLGSVANLRVAPRTGADRYRGQRPPAADIGRELNVTALLDGTVVRSGNEATTTVTLVDAATGRVMLSRKMSAPVRDLVRVEESLANDAVGALAKRFGRLSTSALRSRGGFRSPEAYDLYLQGMYAFRRRGSSLQDALQRFQEAAALDSTAAPLYASLADVFAVMPLYTSMAPGPALDRALPYAERAVALDSASAAARASRGYVFDLLWRWDEGAADLRRAVALDSEFALARQWYGENLLLNGDVEAAVRELGAAARLEPYSAVVAGLHGMATVLLGRVDSGLSMARRAVDLEPTLATPRLLLGAAYLYAGRPFDAVFTLAGAQELDPGSPQVLGMLGYSYAVLGQTAKARAILTRLSRDHDHPGSLSALARIRIGLGNPDEALTLLEQAAKNHDPLFSSEPLLTPIFDPLRQHPRFERLVQQIGLSRRVLGSAR
jgi:TolB-like protein/Flp pilus assembly protein TadD